MATFPLPPTDLYSRKQIRFLHPGYSTPNTLLLLPRVDCVESTTTFGVHYGTALLACQIIAGNAFDTGRLTLDQAGQRPVSLLLNDILTENVYYFMIDEGPSQYPIIPSFRDWEFPHDHIPDSWPEVSTFPLMNRCAISNFAFAIDAAHLIPQEEALWYQRNDIKRYGDAILGDIDNSANIIPLKADLHRCFDNRWFTIVPKVMNTTTSRSPQYVTHILRMDAAELWPTYQNIPVQYLRRNARANLFARFAWAILLQVKSFITEDIPRYVIRIQISDKDKTKTEYKKELLDGPQLKLLYGGGGSKGATPQTKRSRTDSAADDGDSDVNMDDDDDWENMMIGWQQQGKKKREQISSETVVEEDNQAHLLAELKTKLEEVLPGGGDDIPQQG